ncbi:MAG: class I SAM-dependent methyltransferase [Anaerolineae bacterium]|nr:class I SAM-dependent methyltransferase [Anaerolineae bacterium]
MPVDKPAQIEEHDPKFYTFRRDVYLQWAVWAVFAIVAGFLLGGFGVALSLVILGYLLLSTLLRIYHKLQIEQVRHYWQTEALFSLYSTLKIAHPLPPMRLWAASPDFVNLAVSLIREHQPRLVVEIGSGVSTLVSAYALQEIGAGQLISLEHEAAFTQITASNLTAHRLEAVAEVHHTPLRSLTLNDEPFRWYDTAALENLPAPIDLLIVDGPPSGTGPLARYPALPVLYERLRPGAYILVDDFLRDDEHHMVNRWLDAYDLIVVQTFANEKGAAILQKSPPESPSAP